MTNVHAGADPYKCGLLTGYIPDKWIDFAKSRASIRFCAILAMGAMHKMYGKDVARIIGRVVWETRGHGAKAAPKAAMPRSAKKIKL